MPMTPKREVTVASVQIDVVLENPEATLKKPILLANAPNASNSAGA